MSVQSRLRYHYRSLLRTLLQWRLPASIDTVRVRVLIAVLVVVVGGGFIIKTSELSTTGYHVHDLEKQVAALENDTERLETEIATLQSMPNINRRLQTMNMVQPVTVSYIETSKAVAQK